MKQPPIETVPHASAPAASRSRRAAAALAVVVTAGGWFAGGCAGGGGASPETAARPPAAPKPVMETGESPPRPAAPSGEDGAAAVPAAADPALPPVTVVLDDGAYDPEAPRTVAELARRERQRRAATGPPIAVITDQNLAEHATGKLTFAEVPADSAGGDAEATTLDAAAVEELAEREAYWRGRALQVRSRWRDATDAIERLEGEVAGLRRRFYAEDDPHYRDTQIKPAWDRALDLLAEARQVADSSRDELAALVEEGRRAGALPGWLREGIELEPEPIDRLLDGGDAGAEPTRRERRRDNIYEAGEPVIVDEEDDGGGGGLP